MKPFSIALFAALAASAASLPQYGGSSNSGDTQRQTKKKCDWRTVVEYEESSRQLCKTAYQRKCNTLYNKVCTDYDDEVCESYQRRQCDQKQRTKYETWNEDVCEDKYVSHCDKHWEEDSYGNNHWVDNPGSCKDVVDGKNCKQVERKKPYSEAYEDCYNVPDKKCRYVTKQNCKQVPYEDCNQVPYQDCITVHEKKPKQVRRQYCNGKLVTGTNEPGNQQNNNNNNSNNDYNDYDDSGSYTAQGVSDVFDVRNTGDIGTKEVGVRSEGAEIASADEDEEIKSEVEEDSDDSAITFGR